MKYLSALLLASACNTISGFDADWINGDRRLQVLEGFGGTGCSECFDKIDQARDCLRECNQDAHPEDNCCCCCQCDRADDGLPGSDGQCDQDVKEDQCNDVFGQNCQWELDEKVDGARNKWYNLDDYCDCDKNDIDKDNKDKCKDNDRRSNDRSLLDFCLSDNSGDSIESIDDLKECCDFKDNKCDDYFDEVKECLMGCINPCLLTSAGAWLECIRDNGEEGSCSRQECLDGYLEDLPEDLGVDNEPDIFDLDTVFKMVEKIEEEDLEDCSLLREFVVETCDVSNDCCPRCSEQIGSTVDCLINSVVIPFAEGALNTTIDGCAIDTERCRAEFRRLESEPIEPSAVSQEAAAACQRAMETNILAHNMSYATNKFMECIMKEGISALPDTPAGSNAATVFGMFAASLVSFMTALLI